MFARARRRLAVTYVLIFAAVFGVFSAVFYLGVSVVLDPDFDVDPAASSDTTEQAAYRAATARIGIALLVADGAVIGVVGLAAWLLAGRTLAPLRDAHERQRRFVADASHELRTPLAAIRTSIEGAMAGSGNEGRMRATLADVLESTERLTRLTNDLLGLAQTEDRLGARPEAFDLSVAVAEAVETELAARRGSTVGVALTPDVVVSADRDDVSTIVRNLVDNALVHGGSDVGVRVSTNRSAREAVVEVVDHGPGIPAEDLPRLFEPFFRGRRDAAAPSGSGLGLAIAADLARRNGGRLSVVSDVGSGTTFRLTLPLQVRFRQRE
jgi:signal transduction histidine kinase